MCSSVVVFKGIYVPTNDREFVQQATRLLRDVLCLKPEDCTDYIVKLEIDHADFSKVCQQALDNEAERKTKEADRLKSAWKAYSTDLIGNTVIATAVTMAAGIVFAHVFSRSLKTYAALGGVAGLLGGYLFTPNSLSSKEVKSSELRIKANAERNWMKAKLGQVNTKFEEVEKAINAKVGDVDPEVFKTRNLYLIVKSYFEEAVRY